MYRPNGPMTVSELAERCSVTSLTVQRWLRAGRIPGVSRTLGGHYRIDRSAAERFLREMAEEPERGAVPA